MTGTLRVRTHAEPSSADHHDGTAGEDVSLVPNRRRRRRLAVGISLGAVAIAGNLLVYTSLDDSRPVVQVVRDVPAGEQLRADMLRTVRADVDGSVDVVAGGDLESMLGRHARVRLGAGSLLTARSVQDDPLVAPGHAVVAILVPDGMLPVGLRERVDVQLVLADAESTPAVTGTVVALPTEAGDVLRAQSLSVELEADDARAVAASADVRVILLAPSVEDDG